jgi:ribonuclease J
MTDVTVHGGANEIGGNKILVEDQDTRVFFDFGMSFVERRKFFSSFMPPRDLPQMIELGIIPRLDGVYNLDPSTTQVQGVVLSHAHTDHFQCISLLKRDIKIFASKDALKIIEAVTETRPKTLENDISGLSFASFESGRSFSIGSIKITPIEVDHSIPGSYGFIIETSAGTLAYSGDLRKHGRKAKLTRDFISKVSKVKPVALLCEGTHIQSGNRNSEADVLRQSSAIVGGTNGLVFANFSVVDIDRLNTFLRVAQDTDRQLAISPKQAHILSKLEGNPSFGSMLKDTDLWVFKKEKKQYDKWEKKVFAAMQCVTSAEVKKEQSNWIMVSRGIFDLGEMFEIRPEPGSIFLLSNSEPYNEEMEEDQAILRNWLEYFGVPMYTVHSSGHIMPLDLREAIVSMRPAKLYAIHTASQRLFAKFLSGTKVEVVQPKIGDRNQI